MIRGRLLTKKQNKLIFEKKKRQQGFVSNKFDFKLPSFGSYSSSIGAHCFALRASSFENLTLTLSIKGYVISQKPSRSLSSGVGSPADVFDFAY
jgi:hypothetical protein